MLNDHIAQHRLAFYFQVFALLLRIKSSGMDYGLYSVQLLLKRCICNWLHSVCFFIYLISYLIIKFVKQYVNYEHTNGGYYELKRKKEKTDRRFEIRAIKCCCTVFSLSFIFCCCCCSVTYFFLGVFIFTSFSTNLLCARYAGTNILLALPPLVNFK